VRVQLTEPQAQMLMLRCRYPLLVAGYGAGKTHALVVSAIRDLFAAPDTRVAIYSDTYDQIRLNILPRIEELLSGAGIRYRLNLSEMTITIDGRQLIMRSLDNPRRIIGYEVAVSHVDELEAAAPPAKAEDLWRRILARTRQHVEGLENRVAVYTTPDHGFGFTWRRWHKEPPSSEYQYVRASTRSNPYLPEGYLDALLADYPEGMRDAYIEGRWCNLRTGTVYSSYDREACDTQRLPIPGEPLHIGMDFNVGKMAAVVGVRVGDALHIVGELVGYLDTPAMIEAIRERYGTQHNIIVYPDASGASRSTQDASKSDIALLKRAGFTVRARKQNPPVRERVVCVNARFADGRLKVNSKMCPELVEALEQQAYDDKGEPDKTQGYDHITDALGYVTHWLMPLRSVAQRRELWYK